MLSLINLNLAILSLIVYEKNIGSFFSIFLRVVLQYCVLAAMLDMATCAVWLRDGAGRGPELPGHAGRGLRLR